VWNVKYHGRIQKKCPEKPKWKKKKENGHDSRTNCYAPTLLFSCLLKYLWRRTNVFCPDLPGFFFLPSGSGRSIKRTGKDQDIIAAQTTKRQSLLDRYTYIFITIEYRTGQFAKCRSNLGFSVSVICLSFSLVSLTPTSSLLRIRPVQPCCPGWSSPSMTYRDTSGSP
jgi:hypothetical protein